MSASGQVDVEPEAEIGDRSCLSIRSAIRSLCPVQHDKPATTISEQFCCVRCAASNNRLPSKAFVHFPMASPCCFIGRLMLNLTLVLVGIGTVVAVSLLRLRSHVYGIKHKSMPESRGPHASRRLVERILK